MAKLRSSKWLKLFEDFAKDLRITSKESISSEDGGDPLHMWESQRRFLKEVGGGLDRGVHVFNCLKSAQLGVTTISLAIDVFWFALHPNLIGCLVTDDEKKRDANRDLLTKYIEGFPDGYFGERFRIVKNNRTSIHFSNGGRLDLLVAGTKKKGLSWAEGVGYALAHICMAPGTPVIVADGHVRRIEDVVVGDRVLTHGGNEAMVIDVCGQSNTKGPMIRIWPWLGEPVYCTDEHTIPTARGIVEAKDVRKDDLLLMPVRKIERTVYRDTLPSTEQVGRVNANSEGWIRVLSAGSGATIHFNEEFGFAIGYYLAEGHLILNAYRRPCAITFARHRNEGAYSDRAVKALRPFLGKSIKTVDMEHCLTTTVTVYGTSLAMWIDAHFGRTSTKRIPDEVFTWGADFCRGLLAGLLCGDGSKTIPVAKTTQKKLSTRFAKSGKKIGKAATGPSDPDKTYPLNLVVLPTIRSSIATQARDLAASLGYGWGSIRYAAASEKHGRMCQEQWRVHWNGKAAQSLRALMGLPTVPINGVKTEKYEIVGDQVFIKVRSIETGFEEPMMWDLSVDHDDHTFRTTSIAVGNTEIAKYGDVEGVKSLEERFAQQNPHRLYIFESTADGMNHWRTRWYAGVNDPMQCSFFIGWWSGDTNRIEKSDPRFPIYGLYPASGEEHKNIVEVARLYGHRVTPEQLAWYRWKQTKAGAEQGLLDQNQPWTAEQSFVLTGYSFFQVRSVGEDIKKLMDSDIRFQGYRYEFGDSFFQFKMFKLDPEVDSVDNVELKVWEEPKANGKYVIGCDPAYGRNDHKDHNAILVWRCYADRLVQVAEYVTIHDVKNAAWVLFHLASAYTDCIVNVEIQGPGELIMTEFEHLKQLLRSELHYKVSSERNWEDAAANARWYLYHRPDSMGAGYLYNFNTTQRTKPRLMHGFRGCYASHELVIRSLGLLREMSIVVVDDGEIGAPESRDEDCKDDRVFSAAFATIAWTDWVRKDMIAQGMTWDVVTAAESVDPAQRLRGRTMSIVERFLASAEERANEEVPPPKWMTETGLI